MDNKFKVNIRIRKVFNKDKLGIKTWPIWLISIKNPLAVCIIGEFKTIDLEVNI